MDGFKLLEHIGLELDLPVISESLAACLMAVLIQKLIAKVVHE
jgi:hypothetical protein